MTSFGYTIIYVADVPATVAFYERVFGMQRRFVSDEGDYGELATGTTILAFANHSLGASNLPDGYTPVQPDALPPGIEVALVTEDVPAVYQHALAAGAVALVPPKQKPWGQMVGYLRDPNGLLIELCSPMPAAADAPEAVAQAWIERCWRGYDQAAIYALHTPDFVDHSAVGRGTDRAAYDGSMAEFFAAFPDFVGEVEDLITDQLRGRVAVRWSGVGTHQGAFLGVEPRGRQVRFWGIEIVTVRAGQVSERWGEWDSDAIRAQM